LSLICSKNHCFDYSLIDISRWPILYEEYLDGFAVLPLSTILGGDDILLVVVWA
jgi:hypothetical protein